MVLALVMRLIECGRKSISSFVLLATSVRDDQIGCCFPDCDDSMHSSAVSESDKITLQRVG